MGQRVTLQDTWVLATLVSVTLAGHDHMVGARALQMMPGDILNSTGTTEGILQLDTQPTLDEQAKRDKLANGCYSLANQFTLFASLPWWAVSRWSGCATRSG